MRVLESGGSNCEGKEATGRNEEETMIVVMRLQVCSGVFDGVSALV